MLVPFTVCASDFDELVNLAVTRLSRPDRDGPEIKRNLTDAYRFAELNPLPEKSKLGSTPFSSLLSSLLIFSSAEKLGELFSSV